MNFVSVLFVDDEEDIRFGFQDRFETQFTVYSAADGRAALDILANNPDINVVVTDIRMPEMSGLELIEKSQEFSQFPGFIVVSGHADSDDVIRALRLGARNFLRKPYTFEEMEQAIITEARRFRAFREERDNRQRETEVDRCISSIDHATYTIPNNLDWVNAIAFRLTRDMVSVGVCGEEGQLNVVLGLIEIITNAIEHGNLALSSEEKYRLKARGEETYLEEIRRRAESPPYKDRKVTIGVSVRPERAEFTITDQGEGFDIDDLPDPTDPANLFSPSGRGILLARTFLDELIFNERGNSVILVKHRDPVSGR